MDALIEDLGRIVDSNATFQPLAVHQRAPASFAGELQNVPEANLQQTQQKLTEAEADGINAESLANAMHGATVRMDALEEAQSWILSVL